MLIFLFQLDAQRWKRTRYEVLYGINTLNAFTDLGGGNGVGKPLFLDMDFKGTRPGLYLGARYKFREMIAFRYNLLFSWIKASDTYTEWDDRQNRNISSSAPLLENSLVAEYSIQKERFGTRYTFSNLQRFNFKYVNVFLYAGVGGIFAPPAVKNQLHPTNSIVHDGETFHKFNICFPVGIGFKYGIDRRTSFSIDFGHRYTTTDYLDGYSYFAGKSRDSYFTLIFNLTYKLRTARSGLPKF
jgi:hypothetical protein